MTDRIPFQDDPCDPMMPPPKKNGGEMLDPSLRGKRLTVPQI